MHVNTAMSQLAMSHILHLSVHVYISPSKSHLYRWICFSLFTSSVVHIMVLFILTVTANMHDKLMKVIKQYLLTNTTYFNMSLVICNGVAGN